MTNEAIRVKALEWIDEISGEACAVTPFGCYSIEETGLHGENNKFAVWDWQQNAIAYSDKPEDLKAAKLQRTPAWADLELIEVFYATARAMTEETGVPHEVDHVVPMQGESVSGLHVASNLQILTKSENSSKRNKHEDE